MQKSCDDNNDDDSWRRKQGQKGYQSHPVTEC